MFTASFDASNKADFFTELSATDAETGEDIDFTGASISFALRDEDCRPSLTATVGDGITLIDPNILQIHFTADQMGRLCAGAYEIGCVYEVNGLRTQLLTGTLTVYDGIAQL